MLLHKLVVRQIGIEGVDDPVAITPGIRADLVVFKPVGLGEARKIEPVLRPMLALGWRGQQAVDEIFVGARRCVLEKRLHFGGSRRQAGEVEGQPTNQGASIGLGREGKFVRTQLGGDQGINGIGEARIIRYSRSLERLPGPVALRAK